MSLQLAPKSKIETVWCDIAVKMERYHLYHPSFWQYYWRHFVKFQLCNCTDLKQWLTDQIWKKKYILLGHDSIKIQKIHPTQLNRAARLQRRQGKEATMGGIVINDTWINKMYLSVQFQVELHALTFAQKSVFASWKKMTKSDSSAKVQHSDTKFKWTIILHAKCDV